MFIDFIIKSTDTFPDAFLNPQDTAVEKHHTDPIPHSWLGKMEIHNPVVIFFMNLLLSIMSFSMVIECGVTF